MRRDMEEHIEALERMGALHRSSVVLPQERIDAAIRSGLSRAAAERRAPVRRLWRSAAMFTAALLLLFAVTVRMSPAFAEAVSQIPGLDRIVQLIAYDKGLVEAVKNDYYRPVGLSDFHDGITLTVDGVIRDEGRVVMFYTVSDVDGATDAQLYNPRFRLNDGSEFEGGYSWSYTDPGDEGAKGRYSSQVDVMFASGASLPESFTFETELAVNGLPIGPKWEVPIALEAEDMKDRSIVYPLNREIAVEGQRIRFRSVTVYPTRIGVEVEFDEENSKEIFSFVDLTLIGDEGERYTERSTSYVTANRRIHFFEGSSFSIPESLTISGSMLRAMDKERLELLVDTEEGAVLSGSGPDNRVWLASVEEAGDWLRLEFVLEGIAAEDRMLYSIVSGEFEDAAGHTFQTGNGQVYESEPGRQRTTIEIPNAAYEQPLRFHIFNYPEYIYKSFEIPVR